MPSYLSPGVYIEEIPSGSKPIEGVGTSTAVFLGYTLHGPQDTPTLISSWDDYDKQFGGLRPGSPQDLMGRAVYAYYQNGGSKAYVVRIADGAEPAKGELKSGEAVVISVSAIHPGDWANGLVLQLTPSAESEDETHWFDVAVGRLEKAEDDTETLVAEESYVALSLNDDSDRYIGTVVGDNSRLIGDIKIADASSATAAISEATNITLSGGKNGDAGKEADYKRGLDKLTKYRDANTLLLPDVSWDESGKAPLQLAIAHCESMKNRMVILDLPESTELTSENAITSLSLPTSTYAALYYPWPQVGNPFYDPDKNPLAPKLVSVPPSAFAAGHWAKTDSNRGVWKAPAGVGNNLLGLSKLSVPVTSAEQDFLNPMGVNALRQIPGYGAVIWGARTLATKADPEWRYIPVRRTAIFIEESIFNGIHWAVFEPNDHRLWSALRLNIESFMSGLYRSGAFQGEKSSDAFFVRCGLGQTMTQGDIDRGQVIVQVGFAPLKPAEFVIVRIQQKVGQQ